MILSYWRECTRPTGEPNEQGHPVVNSAPQWRRSTVEEARTRRSPLRWTPEPALTYTNDTADGADWEYTGCRPGGQNGNSGSSTSSRKTETAKWEIDKTL